MINEHLIDTVVSNESDSMEMVDPTLTLGNRTDTQMIPTITPGGKTAHSWTFSAPARPDALDFKKCPSLNSLPPRDRPMPYVRQEPTIR
jgi:hypothetical protein